MTKQEKLQAVETAIRKGLPRLMQPTEGCRILEKEYNEIYRIHKINKINFVLYSEDGAGHKLVNKILQPHYKILGHDILISDVLEWFGNKGKKRQYSYSVLNLSNDTLNVNLVTQISDLEHYAFDEVWDKFEIDLSKPRLKDQSEELIDSLYRFLTT